MGVKGPCKERNQMQVLGSVGDWSFQARPMISNVKTCRNGRRWQRQVARWGGSIESSWGTDTGLVIRKGAGPYPTLALCEDIGSRKHAQSLARATHYHTLGRASNPGWAWLPANIVKDGFHEAGPGPGPPRPMTGLQTGVGQQVVIQRPRGRDWAGMRGGRGSQDAVNEQQSTRTRSPVLKVLSLESHPFHLTSRVNSFQPVVYS